MVDIDRLKDVIEDRGMTMTAISNKTGILKATLYNRFKGIGEFTASEIMSLSDALFLDTAEREEIFFARERE